MGNIHVKLYEIRTSGSGDVAYRHSVSRALASTFVQWTGTICKILE